MVVCSTCSDRSGERVAISRKETTDGRSSTDAMRIALLTLGLTT
jgi:hypothetical protein